MTKPSNGLFIPIEIMAREYHGKLLIAVEMASRGIPVFLGHKSSVFSLAKKASEPGILFDKGAGRDTTIDALESRGFAVCVQDEEAGIAHTDYADFYERRLSIRQNICRVSNFFCWGRDEYVFLCKNHPECSEKIKLTGSARTSLWGAPGKVFFRNDILNIKDTFGEYILFNTNFASGNSYLSVDGLEKHLEQYSSFDKNYFDADVCREKFLMERFVRAVIAISENTLYKVIIRPHPTESIDVWKNITVGLYGVHVIRDGPVYPWILGSKAVVHNSCTTGIEAAASGIPAIAYGETQQDLNSCKRSLSNTISIMARDEKELVDSIKNLKQIWLLDSERRQKLIYNRVLDPCTIAPVKNITDHLISISGPPNSMGNSKLGYDSIFHDVYNLYRMSTLRRNLQSIMDQNKRPPILYKNLIKDIARAKKVLNINTDFNVRRVARNCFKISLT